jgi:hypothetical protein
MGKYLARFVTTITQSRLRRFVRYRTKLAFCKPPQGVARHRARWLHAVTPRVESPDDQRARLLKALS